MTDARGSGMRAGRVATKKVGVEGGVPLGSQKQCDQGKRGCVENICCGG